MSPLTDFRKEPFQTDEHNAENDDCKVVVPQTIEDNQGVNQLIESHLGADPADLEKQPCSRDNIEQTQHPRMIPDHKSTDENPQGDEKLLQIPDAVGVRSGDVCQITVLIKVKFVLFLLHRFYLG